MRPTLAQRLIARIVVDEETGCFHFGGAKSKEGYGRIGRGGGSREVMQAHRVVWELMNGPIPKGKGYHGTCALHRCDTPDCIRPSHLFLGTQQENIADRNAKGRTAKGSEHGKAILTEVEVAEIRKLYASGGISQKALGSAYGVSQGTISVAVRRLTWGHVS